jgi:hypothetical protein
MDKMGEPMINIDDKVKIIAISGKVIPDNWRDLIYTITKKEYLGRGLIYYEFMDENGNYYNTYRSKGMIKIK